MAVGAKNAGVGGAGTMKGGEDRAAGDVGVVAVFAEVAEDDLVQAGMGEVMGEFRSLFVGEVAVAPADALLGGPGAFGVGLKERGVVIGLHEQGVDAAEAVADEVGDEADVAEESEAGFVVVDDITDGIDGVMGNGKAFDDEVAKLKGGAGLHEFPGGAAFGEGGEEHFLGEGGAEEGDVVGAAEDFEAVGVVAVFVGEEDAVEIADAEADHGEALDDAAGAEAGIEEEAGVPGAENGAVAGTAAAEDGKRKHGGG